MSNPILCTYREILVPPTSRVCIKEGEESHKSYNLSFSLGTVAAEGSVGTWGDIKNMGLGGMDGFLYVGEIEEHCPSVPSLPRPLK